MNDDEHPLLKQIRARAALRDEADAAAEPSAHADHDKEALLDQIRARTEQRADDDGVTRLAQSNEHSTQQTGLDDIRQRLREQHAARPKRDLTQEEHRKLTALEDILSKLQQGQHIQNRRLKTWLTDEEFAMLTDGWQYQQTLRDEVKQKPDEIVDYEQRLRKATLMYNRAEHYSHKGNRAQVEKFKSANTRELEALLERYAEILHRDPSMTVWFDRQLNFEAGGDAAADIAKIPRVITSKSIEAQSGGGLLSGKQSKREVKIAVVEHAIDRLRYE